jgi:hypothetical protein
MKHSSRLIYTSFDANQCNDGINDHIHHCLARHIHSIYKSKSHVHRAPITLRRADYLRPNARLAANGNTIFLCYDVSPHIGIHMKSPMMVHIVTRSPIGGNCA